MANKTINELDDGGAMIAGDTLVAYRDGETKKVGYDGLQESMIKTLYPIGAIYISAVNIPDMSVMFPGTSWQEFGTGRVLVSVGSGNDGTGSPPRTFDAGEMGGEYEHILDESEMPSHTHSLGDSTNKVWTTPNLGQEAGGDDNASYSFKNPYASIDSTGTTGGGLAHENMPPYIAVYMWERKS